MFGVVPCRPQNLCLASNSKPALKTHFFESLSKFVLKRTLKQEFFSLPTLLPFLFLNGKMSGGLLDSRLFLRSVYDPKCVRSLMLRAHFDLTWSFYCFGEKLFGV